MKMKHIYHICLLIVLGLLAGCATPHRCHYPDRSERSVTAITALFEETRTQELTNGVYRYTFLSDRDAVDGAEALLLHYSRSEDPAIRAVAAARLAHFGTKSALSRALELARTEDSAQTRAHIWSAIAELLQSEPTWPAPRISHSTISAVDTNLIHILSSPDLQVVISCGHPPADFILPVGVTLNEIEDAIITQFLQDTGQMSVEVVDRIPFVPFSARHYTATQTVRQAIAGTLQWTAHGNERILRAFKELSCDKDESISKPASEVVRSLSESNVLTDPNQRGSNQLLHRTQ
jgi:hypothetical protein